MASDYFGQKLKKILQEVANSIFHKKDSSPLSRIIINQDMIENLKLSLLGANISLSVANQLLRPIAKNHMNKKLSINEVKGMIFSGVKNILSPFAFPIDIDYSLRPQVIALCGLNGAGKTTTIGKMANMLTKYGWKVTVAACDLSRKSATDQLKMLCSNQSITIVSQEHEKEKATSIAKRATAIAIENLSDILLIDTNGCYPSNKHSIMDIGMVFDSIALVKNNAPHNVVLVIDATNGKNAHEEIEIFKGTAEITGLVVTKLDAVNRSGVLLTIADRLKLPIHGLGIGSGIEDLQDFSAEEFAHGISGIDISDFYT